MLEARFALSTTPLISEFMASNSSTIDDGVGNASDWIEVYNPTAAPINLAGWHLTDDAANLDKWTFPAVPQAILDPGEHLVVFASSQLTETYIDPLGYMHTDFALSAGGEYLALTDPREVIIHEYAPEFSQQFSDVSYGLIDNATSLTLVGAASTATAIVPTTGALDSPAVGVAPAWTLPEFDDSAWIGPSGGGAGVGVGFDTGDVFIPGPVNGVELAGLIGHDLTDPEDDGVLNGAISSGGSSPGGEEPPKALDNSTTTKWLSFLPEGTFYQFRFSGGERQAVNGYTISSANDAPNRDPYTWTLSGSNDGVNFTALDTRTAQDFDDRFQTRYYEFNNGAAYEYYKFDFLTEFGATGQNAGNSIQIGEIELLSSGPIDYNALIDVNLASRYAAAQTSIYQRIEFVVEDPDALASLKLDLRYDDGVVVYLNGRVVAAASAPGLPTFQSNATAERDDSDSLTPQSFNLFSHLDKLVAGVNVLAIHVLNVADASPDMLSIPLLSATQLLDDAVVEAFMPLPSPGAPNTLGGVTFGPEIASVTSNPPRPAHNQNLLITAEINAADSPIDDVTLHYRVMYGTIVAIAMNDSGTGGDALSGDGVYSVFIPESAYAAGQMVRWYVTADDESANESRFPYFFKPDNSPEYFGTVVQTAAINTNLPIFEYFVENVSASGTETGTRGQVFFRGEFYDNVFVRRRGGNTTQGRKFEFNDGFHFLFDPLLGRVDEINLNQRGAESTYMRQVLAWDVYEKAGLPASIGEAWHTRLNGAYQDVRIFVEQPDSDLLRRTGLDPEGALYKIGADGVENSITSSTNGVRKRTRKNENNSDLQALVNGVSTSNANRLKYVFDNVDVAAVINYIAATGIMHDNDHPHKNYHVYRDTLGSQQWMFIPWDKDLTFGLNFGVGGLITSQDPFSHPFFGDQDHQKVDRQWNRLIDAVLDAAGAKEMLARRLRTLMDEILGAPGTTGSWLQNRVAQLKTQLTPELNFGGWSGEVDRILSVYLVGRRQHLYVNHSINNPGYPDNARIPNAQVGNPSIKFGAIENDPVSGNQDQEYIELKNPHATAVDISNWRLEGGVTYTFTPGTVIPAGGSLYVSPHVPTFLARTTGPRGGQMLFVQGNFDGHIKSEGELIRLVASDNSVIAQVAINGDFDQDNDVDGADFLAWQRGVGTRSGATTSQGDADRDGDVDGADLAPWKINFGAIGEAAATAAAVPAAPFASRDPLTTADAPPTANDSAFNDLAIAVANRDNGASPARGTIAADNPFVPPAPADLGGGHSKAAPRSPLDQTFDEFGRSDARQDQPINDELLEELVGELVASSLA